MNHLELVKVGHARHNLGKLKVTDQQTAECGGSAGVLTSRKRFSVGFAFPYRITSPLGIHSVRISKLVWLAVIKTPNNGKIFGWVNRFHPMTSRHNLWVKVEWGLYKESIGRYLENPIAILLVHSKAFYCHGGSRVFPFAHICEPAAVENPLDVNFTTETI